MSKVDGTRKPNWRWKDEVNKILSNQGIEIGLAGCCSCESILCRL